MNPPPGSPAGDKAFCWPQRNGTLRTARPSDDALAHAIKKLLFPGQRGSKGVVTDLVEAVAAIKRAIELEVGECEESASHPN